MIPLAWSALANHIWQSTLFAGMAASLTLALRQNRAQVRYALWLAASIKFLVPISLLMTAGSLFEWRTAPPIGAPLSSAFVQVSQPFAAPLGAAATSAARVSTGILPALLLLVWLGGSAVVLSYWWVRWLRVRTALRTSVRLKIHAPVEVRSSSVMLEPGIFGIFRPVLLLSDGIVDRLTPGQFQAILAHEFCHVRRRDNVTAALHMVVEAVFWFHPLVWWIGSRLVEERERACDEDVLRLGNQPAEYAAGILNVCKFYVESPLPCAPGVTGADLNKRIEFIMTRRMLRNLTLARKLLLAAAGIAAVAGPIAIGVLHLPQGRAQGKAAPLRFEVASIKPTSELGSRGGLDIRPGGELWMSGATLRMLISFAYDIPEARISGGPSWVGSAGFDIDAKPERVESSSTDPSPAPGTTGWQRMQQRLQGLLAERFQLVIRRESKSANVYVLVLAKGGSRLQPSKDPTQPAGTVRGRNEITGRAGTVEMLAKLLENWLGRPVANRTGLTGRYDYKLEYAIEPGPGGRGGSDDAVPEMAPPGPSLFAALQDQLGLKLESTHGSVVTIVIERAEKPSN